MSEDIVERLRHACAITGWAVVNTETKGIVIWFSDREEVGIERKARAWLQEHAATHRTHEVQRYEDPCIEHEAASEIDRLRTELQTLHTALQRIAAFRPLTFAECSDAEAIMGIADAVLKKAGG